MALRMDDTGEIEGKAPRPIDADSVARGRFKHLQEGQGAISASSRYRTADEAQDALTLPISKRALVLVCVAALLAIAVAVIAFVRVLDAPAPAVEQVVEPTRMAAEVDQGIVSRGVTYELVDEGGVYQLVETVSEGDDKSVPLGGLEGTPAGLILYDGAIIIPQNLDDDTWNVVAYTIGSGWSHIMDRSGDVVAGNGTVTDADLDGSVAVLTVDGTRVEVPLAW